MRRDALRLIGERCLLRDFIFERDAQGEMLRENLTCIRAMCIRALCIRARLCKCARASVLVAHACVCGRGRSARRAPRRVAVDEQQLVGLCGRSLRGLEGVHGGNRLNVAAVVWPGTGALPHLAQEEEHGNQQQRVARCEGVRVREDGVQHYRRNDGNT